MIYLLCFSLLFNAAASPGPFDSVSRFVSDTKSMWQEAKDLIVSVKIFFKGFSTLLMRLMIVWVAVLLFWFMVDGWFKLMLKWTGVLVSVTYFAQWLVNRSAG